MNEFTLSCGRCPDPFHVIEWAMDALLKEWREAPAEAVQATKAKAKAI